MSLEDLWAWRRLGPGGALGLGALRACHYYPPSLLLSFQVDQMQNVVSTLFLLFVFLCMKFFFRKFILAKPTPLYNFFRPKCVEMSKLP